MRRSAVLLASLLLIAAPIFAAAPRPQSSLPERVVFVGKGKYEALIRRGVAENWRQLPLGERTVRAGLALVGTPYKNYTLELDERIETPCVNMDGMDCWTFFEIALGTARALKVSEVPTTTDMLRMIELDRYRDGRCNGIFTSRLHYLEQWLHDNERRGLVTDITPKLPGAKKLHRNMKEMSASWKSSKQLVANRSLIPEMARIEQELSQQGIWYVPNSKIAAAEKYIHNGDIISIVTTWPRGYTSHVGIAYRDKAGVLRFLHASRNERKVFIDSRLSTYVKRYKSNAGIMVARPKDI